MKWLVSSACQKFAVEDADIKIKVINRLEHLIHEFQIVIMWVRIPSDVVCNMPDIHLLVNTWIPWWENGYIYGKICAGASDLV